MKTAFTFVLLGVTHLIATAQITSFSLTDAVTNLPLEKVEVFSHEAHDKPAFTSSKGLVKYDIDHTDTLIFFKKGYHPLYIQVKSFNFDKGHVIELKMAPGNKDAQKHSATRFSQLEKVDHSFEHDSLPGSSVHVTHYLGESYTQLPSQKDRSFHFINIGIDKQGTSEEKSSYHKKEAAVLKE